MKILLFGKFGQLGWELERTLACLGSLTTLDYPEVDFKQPRALAQIVREAAPDLIVNAVAYTDVDKAEDEPEIARAINAISVGVIAEEARKRKAPIIHYSTDYVFDGTQGKPYIEDDATNPINIYGRTKLEGELAIRQAGGAYLILRTSWVYSLRKGGFVNKVLEWSRKQETLRIVDDQVGSPTWARLLAEASTMTIARGMSDLDGFYTTKTGIYHLAGNGMASRYEWAKKILESDPDRSSQTARDVLPAKSVDFPTPAARPSFSALDCMKFERAFGVILPSWQESLRLALGS